MDPGFVKQKTYNAERRMESLVVVPISRVAGKWLSGMDGSPCHYRMSAIIVVCTDGMVVPLHAGHRQPSSVRAEQGEPVQAR